MARVILSQRPPSENSPSEELFNKKKISIGRVVSIFSPKNKRYSTICAENAFCECIIIIPMKMETVIENYLNVEGEAEELAEFFSAFSDKTRMKILCLLAMDDLCVNDLGFVLRTKQSTVSHQLRTMKDYGLVNCYKFGKKTYYYLRNNTIEKLLTQAIVTSEELKD